MGSVRAAVIPKRGNVAFYIELLMATFPLSGFVMKTDETLVLIVRGRILANDLAGFELVFRFDNGELA